MSAVSVGINLLWLVPGDVGGSEESTLASVRALVARHEPDLELRLYVLEPFLAAHPDLAESLPTDVLPISGRGRFRRIAAEASWLAARSRDVTLVHHAGGTAPLRRGAPYVLTLHDLQPLERRATHGTLKRTYLGRVIPPSVRGARLTAVPSEFVRHAVLARFPIDPDRVVAIPHGVEVHPSPTSAAEVTDRFRLDGPVVLYPAITYPHKNHAVLVESFAQVLRRHPEALLVLTGGHGSEEDRLRGQIARLGIGDRVRRLGRISAADLAGLYTAASVVAVPSRYEGFGLPAAEAMAYGRPLVAASETALPEVVGDGGLLVDPEDAPAWATAIADLLDDPPARAELSRAATKRAARYTWAANAARLSDLYRQAR